MNYNNYLPTKLDIALKSMNKLKENSPIGSVEQCETNAECQGIGYRCCSSN